MDFYVSRLGVKYLKKEIFEYSRIDKIDLERANDFVKIMINKLLVKHGSEEISSEIRRDNSDSTISNNLTHIIRDGESKKVFNTLAEWQERLHKITQKNSSEL